VTRRSPTLATASSVLVVDDEPVLLRVIRWSLEALGYRVYTAGTGGEALDLLERAGEHVALVLTDVKMAPMDGGVLLREARRRGFSTPFLFMSGHPAEQIRELVGIHPNTRTLAKPWTSGQLAAAVRVAMAAPSASSSSDATGEGNPCT